MWIVDACALIVWNRCMHLLFGCNWDTQRMRIKKNIAMRRPAE